MPLRVLRAFGLAWFLLVFCISSCGGDPIDDGDACTLDVCDPDQGVVRTRCSKVAGDVTTTLDQSAKFLYEGPNPVQVGVDTSALDPRRAAVIRGKITHDDAPVAGATVSIAGHASFGHTLSQCNGEFDLVVNGGAALTVSIESPSFLPVRRRVEPRWQTYTVLPEVVLTTADAPIEVDLAAGAAVQASLVKDRDGERRATLLFQPGTVATVDGQPLGPMLNVRATEYTVGADGPKKMPATLPESSGYTYAVEYGIDEAAKGKSVTFNPPVFGYVDNFLKMPVGTRVPAGYYDKPQDAWLASDDGQVIQILSIHGGLVDVDSDGDGAADDGLGMSQNERAQLASLYKKGQTIWRVPIKHFSSWDYNWAFGFPSDAIAGLKALNEFLSADDTDGACKASGSIIECENQTLGEAFPVSGTRFSLNYWSDRVPGRRAAYTLKLHVLPVPKPESLKRIDVTFSVAGQVLEQHFDCMAAPGCDSKTTATFAWDGKDVYGRTVQGRQPVLVRIGYAYDGVYEAAPPNGFGQPGSGTAITGSITRQEVSLESTWHGYLGTFRAVAEGLGGFTLNVHHRYDPLSQTIYFGNGDKQTATTQPQVIALAAGGDCLTNCNDQRATGVRLELPQGVAVMADGTLFIAETNKHRILRVTPDGYVSIAAGTGKLGFQDGPVDDPNRPTQLSSPEGLAMEADGALLIADTGNNRIRRLKDGQLTTVAGNGNLSYDPSQEGVPASQAALWAPSAVAALADGTYFITDRSNHRVRRVDPSSRIWLFAGTGTPGASGNGGKAIDAAIGDPTGVAVGKDGSVYVAQSSEHWVRRIRPDGVIEPFAGTGTAAWLGDGGPAQSAALNWPAGLGVGADGSVYIADSFNNLVRRVGTDGSIQTIAGTGLPGSDGDGGLATAAKLNQPRGVAVAPDGTLYVGDVQRVRRIDPSKGLPGYTGIDDVVLASTDGSLLYLFSGAGKHRETRDAYTGAVLLSFGYTDDGLLTSITDDANNTTQIRRPSAEQIEIVSPFGKVTTLSLSSSGAGKGYVQALTNPEKETVTFFYGPSDFKAPFSFEPSDQPTTGLMTGLTDPKKQHHEFTYDPENLGRLVLDQDPAGGSKRLTRTEADGAKSFSVDVTTVVSADPAASVTTTHTIESLDDGSERRTVTRPDELAVATVSMPDGSSQTSYVDGTVVTALRAPDPRFGMQAPFAKEMTIATGGKTLRLTMTREATLADPKDLRSFRALTESVTVNGDTFTRLFDVATRQFTSRTPEGYETYTWLDERGRVVGVQPKGLAKTTVLYDDKGRVWKVTAEHPTQMWLSRTVEFRYRPDGELDVILDPSGEEVAKFDFTDAGWLRSITEPYDGGGTRTTGFARDPNGNLWTLTPPGKPAHTFEHTPVDLVSLYTPPSIPGVTNPSTSYVPTLDQQPDRIILPHGTASGEVVDVNDDDRGRPHTITTTTAGPPYALTLNYSPSTDPDPDKRGKRESLLGPTAGTEIHFDHDGQLETGTTTQGVLPGGAEIALSRGFDDHFRVRTETVNGGAVSFDYDDDSILSTAGDLIVTRDPVHGLIAGTTLTSGGHTITDTRIYSPFEEPDLYTASHDGVEIFRIRYEPFTSHSQLHKKTETIKGGTPHDFEYEYNAARQLYAYKKDGGAATIYLYDPNGNRTGPGWGIADDQDRLPNSPAASEYTYKANGELLTKTVAGATTTYTTDLFDNLRTVQRPAPMAPITYGIDGGNRRVSKSVGGVLQRAWAHNGGRIVAEFNGAGTMTARFVYGTRPQVPDYRIEVVSGQVYRILTDHLGSVRLVVRLSDGAIVQQLAYDPWGDVEMDTKPGFQPFGFAGGLYDPDTRLVQFGARDYDPAIGRWTAKDPSGFAGGTNLYAYADNDPVNLVDLTGENPVFFILAGAAEGIAGDLLFQMTVGGKRWGCLDGQELAIAGIVGALTGGLGAPAARAGAAIVDTGVGSTIRQVSFSRGFSHAMKNHLTGSGPNTLRTLDPGGPLSKWSAHVVKTATTGAGSPRAVAGGEVLEIMAPMALGAGRTTPVGVRLFRAAGEEIWRLTTILTHP
jgi:RHS repeat-associated protein